MPRDMSDIMHIPIEAFRAIQHNLSIYSKCIYNKPVLAQPL